MIKFKLLIIILILGISALFPIGGVQSIKLTLLSIFISLVLGVIFIELQKLNSLFNQLIIEKPRWKDKLNLKKPLTYLHFTAYIFIAAGLGGLVGGFFIGQIINYIGIILLTFGIGQLIGIYLFMLSNQKK